MGAAKKIIPQRQTNTGNAAVVEEVRIRKGRCVRSPAMTRRLFLAHEDADGTAGEVEVRAQLVLQVALVRCSDVLR